MPIRLNLLDLFPLLLGLSGLARVAQILMRVELESFHGDGETTVSFDSVLVDPPKHWRRRINDLFISLEWNCALAILCSISLSSVSYTQVTLLHNDFFVLCLLFLYNYYPCILCVYRL